MRISFEGPQDYVNTIFDIVKEDRSVTKIDIKEVAEANGKAEAAKHPHGFKPQDRSLFAKRMWAIMEPVFDAALGNGHDVAYDQPELRNVIQEAGFNAGSISTAFTALVREGIIERVARGLYRKVTHP